MSNFNFTGAYGGNNGENIVPRAVVVIGGNLINSGTPTIPLTYDLTMNSFLETDILEIVIPSELLDMSGIIKQSRKQNNYIGIELWSGFLPVQHPQHSWTQASIGLLSNDQMKKDLLNSYKTKLTKRWFGVVEQPKIRIDQKSGDFITLICKELFTLFQDYIYEKMYEGEASSVENVIKDIAGSLTSGLNIIIDPDIYQKYPDRLKVLMGLHVKFSKDGSEDQEELKQYSTVGKTVFDIIVDICRKSKLKFVQSETESFTYMFTVDKSSSTLWTLDANAHFQSCELAMGKSGNSNSNKFAVEFFSKQKDGTTTIKGTFPRNLTNDSPESQKLVSINGGVNKTKSELEAAATDYALNYSKTSIVGTMHIPNAITNLKPTHLLRLNDTRPIAEYRKLTVYTNSDGKEINFRINSISEKFGLGNGLEQTSVEFELDRAVNSINESTGEITGSDLLPSTIQKMEKINTDTIKMIDNKKILANRKSNSYDYYKNNLTQ